jgi:hypothetical protein
MAARLRAESTGLVIMINGTGMSTIVMPGGTFTFNGVPSGDITLHITGMGTDTSVTITSVSGGETIHLAISLSGSQADVNITDREKPDHSVELEGLIGSINTSAQTLKVNGTTVSLGTGVVIRHGDRSLVFTDLKVGQRVHVKGTMSGTVLIASAITLQDQNEQD